ncbi:20177_t:CDS:2 [Racocetra fulgida]|uniref:20177_t:CDS:1 n=1 Tax=Racocetra fulgida TaxID=60492 RepID=A0A9N9I4L7_9GLOM|nr:20177_t:CDS:2 [Racocetra fulgida]
MGVDIAEAIYTQILGSDTPIPAETEIRENNSEFKQWTNLFPTLKKGQVTFPTYTPKIYIFTKNNASIFDISSLENISLNETISTTYVITGNDFIGAVPRHTKGKWTHLEIVFTDEEKQHHYATEGIGWKGSDSNKKIISERIRKAFDDVGYIKSIKSLVYKNTPFCTNQWIILFDKTEDPNLEQRIPRHTSTWGPKAITE